MPSKNKANLSNITERSDKAINGITKLTTTDSKKLYTPWLIKATLYDAIQLRCDKNLLIQNLSF
jgi:hypothetical protein